MNKNIKIVILILILALGLAGRFYWFMTQPLDVNFERGDGPAFDNPAWNLIQGQGYTLDGRTPYAGREPGYIFFLAAVYSFFGPNHIAAYIIQIFIDVLTIYLVFLIGVKLLNQGAGLLAAFFVAIDRSFMGMTNMMMPETLFIFALAFSVYWLLKTRENPSVGNYILVGLFFGLTTLIKGTSLLWPIFLLLMALLFFRQKSLIIGLLIVLFFHILTLSPWLIRNWLVFDYFVPIRFGSAEGLWNASYIPWQGKWIARQLEPEPWYSMTQSAQGDPVKAEQIFSDAFRKNIQDNPLGVAKIYLNKIPDFWLIPLGGHWSDNIFINAFKLIRRSAHYIILILAALAWPLVWFLSEKGRVSQYLRLTHFILLSLLIFIFFTSLLMDPTNRYIIPFKPYIYLLAASSIAILYENNKMQKI